MTNWSNLYSSRFDPTELEAKDRVWKVLCSHAFQRYVEPRDTVLDVGAGACEFINNIECGRKFALDTNPDTKQHANDDVEVFLASAVQIPLPDGAVDLAFASNFFEHLPNKQVVLEVLRELRRVLRPTGSLLIMQPNFRFTSNVYWDFLDHNTPLTDRSMTEALLLTGFEAEQIVPRFLPYTTKGKLPSSSFLLRLYLKLRPAWWVFGKQMLIRARSAG